MKLTTTELALFLEGSTLIGKVPLSPPPYTLPARASLQY